MENVTNNPWFNVPSGERLKICRKRLNLTHSQLMDKVSELPENKGKGRSEKQIGYIESGKRQMSAEYARLFAKVLGVQPSFLLCETDFETEYARFEAALDNMERSAKVLHAVIQYVTSSKGYEIEPVDNRTDKEQFSSMDESQFYYVIKQKGTPVAYCSLEKYTELRREIFHYTSYLLDNIINHQTLNQEEQHLWLTSKNAGTNPEN